MLRRRSAATSSRGSAASSAHTRWTCTRRSRACGSISTETRPHLSSPAHSPMKEAWIIEAVRTPVGRHGGSLARVRPDDLAAVAVKGVLQRTGIDPQSVDDVILGCANQAGEDNRNVARMALLLAGLPVAVPGQTVNRLCGSGMQAVCAAFHAIRAGEGEVFIAGGVESMSRAPYVMLKPEEAYARGAPKIGR